MDSAQQFDTWLYRLRLNRPEILTEGPTEDEMVHLQAHGEYITRLTGEGTVLLAGRTMDLNPEGMGIVILRADSEEAARSLMENDPTVKAGVMNAMLFPYRIAFESISSHGTP